MRAKPHCILGDLAALSWYPDPKTVSDDDETDLELLQLEEVLRLARLRLTQVIDKVGDPAAIKAAEELCAEAAAAVAAHKA